MTHSRTPIPSKYRSQGLYFHLYTLVTLLTLVASRDTRNRSLTQMQVVEQVSVYPGLFPIHLPSDSFLCPPTARRCRLSSWEDSHCA